MSPRARAGGFTLIELVLTLGILAVSAALVLPAVGRGVDSLRLRSEAGRVAALLRDARQHAITHRAPTRVGLDTTRNTVAATVANPDRVLRQLKLRPEMHVSAASGGETVSFSPRGITREARWIVEGGGRRLAIEVEAVSGRVTVRPEKPS